ncbi:required for excision 1-B domain-containing protein isoform X1 [Puma concolor]|uniref:Required for excision 1-B domain-containing protein isoform X1 n=1 Tax=Puma concolor TaxID=9696 RepID=A0A6P6H8W8_PUMCO|nr:required for excision 1-B domain-containing protein isoform X1 [Puma concolor]
MITAKASADSAVPSVHDTAVATGVPEREEPEWPWKDAPIRALVQRIHQLQAERAQAFRRLEEGHLQYLRSGPPYDFPRYRSTVHEVTQAFAAASREVLAVEAELSGPRGQPLLASHVRSLQQLEQTRLATVLALLLPWFQDPAYSTPTANPDRDALPRPSPRGPAAADGDARADWAGRHPGDAPAEDEGN